MPSRPDFFHCSRRCSASMPSGEEDEIPERVNPLLFFFAPAAARAFLVFATSNPSLRRESDRLVTGFRGDSGLVAHRHGNQSGTDFQTAGAIPPEIAARPRSVKSIPPSKSMACLLAGNAVLIAPVSGPIRCKQGIFQGILAFGSLQECLPLEKTPPLPGVCCRIPQPTNRERFFESREFSAICRTTGSISERRAPVSCISGHPQARHRA